MSHRPTVIAWYDAYTGDDVWTDAGTPPEPPVVVWSAGWIIDGHLDGYTVIAASRIVRDGHTTYGGLTYIPDAMVVDA